MHIAGIDDVQAESSPEDERQMQVVLNRARKLRDALLRARSGKLFPRSEDDLDDLRDDCSEGLSSA